MTPSARPFRVLLRDGSKDEWGLDLEAAYEVGKRGDMRVVVFEAVNDGLHHARTARIYGTDEWKIVEDL